MKNVRQLGYSLFEMLLTLSIVATSLLMLCPSFQSIYYKVKTYSVVQEVKREIFLARNEAIRLQQKIVYCTDDINKDWSGQRMIHDQRGRNLHTFKPFSLPYKLILRNSLGKNKELTFTPLGLTNAEHCSFYLYAPDETIRLTLTLSGRLREEPIAPPFVQERG